MARIPGGAYLPVLLLLVALGPGLAALPVEPVRDGQVEAGLILSHHEVAPGMRFQIGVRYRMDPDWHIYWRNPGDSGLPPVHQWELPDGMTVGPILWPVPEWYAVGELATFVYHGEVVLLQEFQVPVDAEPGRPLPIRLGTDWLMCEVPCIPGSAAFAFEIPVGQTAVKDPVGSARIEEAMGRLPEPRGATGFLLSPTDGAPQHLEITDSRLKPGMRVAAFPDDDWWRPEGPATASEGRVTFAIQTGPTAPDSIETLSGVLRIEGEDGAVSGFPFEATPAGSFSGGVPEEPAGLGFLILLIAFGGGVILNVMPCVFPVLGLKVLHLAERSGDSTSKTVLHGGAYALGVLVSFWILALLVIFLRARIPLTWGFQLQSPEFVFSLTAFLLVFALNLSGVFEFGYSLTRAAAVDSGGYGGSFLSGVLATTVSTPCSAPLVGTALSAAFALPSIGLLVLFSVMGLGLAAPLVILLLLPPLRRRLPRPGPWMETVKQFLAFPLYATAAWLIWNLSGQVSPELFANSLFALVAIAMAAWVLGRFAGPTAKPGGRRIGTLAAALLVAGAAVYGWPAERPEDSFPRWEPWSRERVEELVGEGRPIYVDFTARWCLTCKVNKARVFGSETVETLFRERNVALLRADLTSEHPEASEEIEAFGRAAVPMNLVYLPGRDRPVLLPELIGPNDVLEVFGEQ